MPASSGGSRTVSALAFMKKLVRPQIVTRRSRLSNPCLTWRRTYLARAISHLSCGLPFSDFKLSQSVAARNFAGPLFVQRSSDQPDWIRVQTRSQPECDGRGERDSGEIVPSELVVSGSYAAEVLEPAEHRLDPPAITVASFIILDRPLAIAPAGDDRGGALLAEGRAQPVGIIASVSDQASCQPVHR